MFDNVPDWVSEKVRDLSKNPDLNQESVYLHAAGWVIAFYIHKDVSKPEENRFFDHRVLNESGDLWHGHVNRVMSVGESLFYCALN